MAGSERIAIVLSTFNGSVHLAAQLESIQRQHLRDWTLLVRDDGSSDETLRILRRFAVHDARILILDGGGTNLGAITSFGRLLQTALDRGAEYVFLADQDDVWLPDKLSRQLELMQACEWEHSSGTPVLVHSDLTVVDDSLRTIHPSFLRYQRLRHERKNPLNVLLVQNFVTGCATLVNRPLLRLALPFPPVVGMHDWWLAQCAAAGGTIAFLPQPTVLYRQHGANVVGARGFRRLVGRAFLQPHRWWTRSWANFSVGLAQCCYLAQRLREIGVPPGPRTDLVEEYCTAVRSRDGALRRLGRAMRLGVRPQTAVRRPFFYLRLLLTRPGIEPCNETPGVV